MPEISLPTDLLIYRFCVVVFSFIVVAFVCLLLFSLSTQISVSVCNGEKCQPKVYPSSLRFHSTSTSVYLRLVFVSVSLMHLLWSR